MPKAIALLSGGLDSQLAVRLMIDQGVEVECLTSASVFHHRGPEDAAQHPAVLAAKRMGVPIRVVDTNAEMMTIVLNPEHGRGKNMNPCIDCRIFLLRTAHDRMREIGADFIVTGEVVGQRPMSQQRNVMRMIEKKAGVVGLLLRPLSAKLLEPTDAEKNGLIDRQRLLAIAGRSRKEQMALAATFGITDYPTPAGGCLLTDPGFSRRLAELMQHGEMRLDDVRLLRVGRHFRLDDRTKAVVGRHERDNAQIETLSRAGDLLFDAADVPGPTTLLRGDATHANIESAARLTAAYGKARDEPSVRVAVRRARSTESFELTVAPATGQDAAGLIITGD